VFAPTANWLTLDFAAQPPMPLEPDKLEEILVGADRVWMDAFARMTLDDSHNWRRHRCRDRAKIASETGITAGQAVLDALEALPPSNTMEASGDIFDPSLLLLYRGVHYARSSSRRWRIICRASMLSEICVTP
jgi:hypothetical protein